MAFTLNPFKVVKGVVSSSYSKPVAGLGDFAKQHIKDVNTEYALADEDGNEIEADSETLFSRALAIWGVSEDKLPAMYKRMLIVFWLTFSISMALMLFALYVVLWAGASAVGVIWVISAICGAVVFGTKSFTVSFHAWQLRTMSLGKPPGFFSSPFEWFPLPLTLLADEAGAEVKYPLIKLLSPKAADSEG